MDNQPGKQIGGSHYKKLKIDPYEYCFVNNIGPLEFNVIKYVTRWRDKNGIEDIRKAIHTLERLLELENARLQQIHLPKQVC